MFLNALGSFAAAKENTEPRANNIAVFETFG
jgi:hypothetical protein